MTAETLLADLRARGIRIAAKGTDGLRLEAPPGTLGREDLERLRLLKPAVLEALREPVLPAAPLEDASIAETRDQVGAVLVRSLRFGDVWIALDPCLMAELGAEEAATKAPRPVLLIGDLLRLRGKPELAIRAALEVARVFPGSRVLS